MITLAIDPAATSGWAIGEGGRVLDAGIVRSAAERRDTIRFALDIASSSPLCVVAEDWTAGGELGIRQILGMGAAWGRWAEAIELAGISPIAITRVYPQTWRSVLAPLARRTGEEAKRSARVIARGLLKRRDIATDAAEAACICKWAMTQAAMASVARTAVR